MGQLQEFLGIENYISEKNFDMEDRLPCFKENVETKCLKGTKGRSVGKQFENDYGQNMATKSARRQNRFSRNLLI